MAQTRPAETARRRIESLQVALRETGWAAALIQHPRDVFYYAGTGQPCNLWVPAEGEPVLFARRVEEWVREDSLLPDVVGAPSFGQMRRHLAERGLLPPEGAAIGIEKDVLPASLVESLGRTFPGYRLENVAPAVLSQRLVKGEAEIAAMRAAAALWAEVHAGVLEALRPGARESDLAATALGRAMRAGAGPEIYFRRWDGTGAAGRVVASGPNGWRISGPAFTVTGVGLGPAQPWGYGDRVIGEGDLVVVDFGLYRQGYHADITRTYAVGKPSPRLKDLWDRLVELHQAVIAAIRPGVRAAELWEIAREHAARAGYADWFMGYGRNQGQYIGHSLGLEMDEPPVLGPGADQELVPGMVVTVEPKFIVPGTGAAMIEDEILVTPTGGEVLGTVEQRLFEVT